jgi:chaperone modulatory protein CbpM
MMETSEFIVQSRLGEQVLEAWVKVGWLLPRQDGSKRDFSDVDLARAQLIRDLESLGVNDEGIPVILDLVDQMHGLRRTLRDLLSAIRARPEAMQRWIVADLRRCCAGRPTTARKRRPRTSKIDSLSLSKIKFAHTDGADLTVTGFPKALL